MNMTQYANKPLLFRVKVIFAQVKEIVLRKGQWRCGRDNLSTGFVEVVQVHTERYVVEATIYM
jgi:hypothetical protein